MLISHCHVQAQSFGDDKINEGAGTIPVLLDIMHTLGVDRAVCFAPFGPQTEAKTDANEWLLEAIAPHPELIGFATVDPKSEGAGDRLRELVARGMRGAKYHPPVMQTAIDDPACADYWEAVNEMRLPVHIHTGAHGWYLRRYQPLLLDDICSDYPDARIIMDHMGCTPFFLQALAVLHNNTNAFCGLTQMSGRSEHYRITDDNLALLQRTVWMDRIIYGFDYPWNPDNRAALSHDITWVKTWGRREAEVAAIMGGNMERLISEVRVPG
ncbi:MAG: amidohydrolase family protein [Armatimonadetes bacterium]|nr:amidohydrolase family protein [Armatimonadota bacterium]